MLNSLKPGQKDIPQTLVDRVMERVREEHGPDAPGTDEETVRKALEQLKIMDVVQGKAGVAGRGEKDLGTHKVCIDVLHFICVLNFVLSSGAHNLFLNLVREI